MSVLTIVLLVLVILIALLLIIASVSSKEYVIEEEITIGQPVQKLYDYLRHLKNQDYYSKWVMMDPQAKKEYTGTDGTVGFIASWDSENKQVGKGAQEIIQLKEGERIDLEVRFEKPFKATAYAYFLIQPANGGQSKVIWGFRGTRNLLMKVMHLLINMKKMIGNDLATGLRNLKTVMEK